MNKDLEIIKNNLGYFMLSRTDKYGRECAKNIINLAAERMAEEIERLEAELNYREQEIEGLRNGRKLFENNIKAELEKRPEVVRCGECIHQDTSDCICAYYESENGWKTDIRGPNDFCSRGQRRESEVKDGKK